MNNNREPNMVIYEPYLQIPRNLISEELTGLYGSRVLREMGEIIEYYDIYENGASFTSEGANGDYLPTDLRIKQAASLINKEARFLFSKKPDIWVDPVFTPDDEKSVQAAKDNATIMQAYVDKVLEKNKFFGKLIKAAKDCFIGKRVALFVNFNEETQKIQINFTPSLEFVYEVDGDDIDILTKIVCFFTMYDSQNKTEQRIYKKKYWMENGFCHIEEGVYDGTGKLIEEITPARPTKFSYIPAVVIRNDGLTGDLDGTSEIKELMNYEEWNSRLNSADIDAERKGMNSIKYVVDMNPSSTKGLSTAPGAFWDLSSDQNIDGSSPQIGSLEPSMGYSGALNTTLNRIKSAAYSTLDIPDTSPDALQGVITSGKALKALYWGLIVRCDEKMQEWRPALEHLVKILIDGAHLYPGAVKNYSEEPIPDVPFDVRVDNQYSLPEDEVEEKQVDIAEVQAQTLSRKSYMKKWRNLTDEEADNELKQIALERQLLEDSFAMMGMENPQQRQPEQPEGDQEPQDQAEGKTSKPEEPEEMSED